MKRAALLLLLLLVPIGAHAADPVIGAVYPATGAGVAAREAIDTALEIVNGAHAPLPVLMGAGNGLDRMNGAKLAVAYADPGPDGADAAAAAERLVSQGAVVLIGGLSDPAAAAISHVAEAHGLPFLALNSGLPNDAGLTWFFRLGRTPARDAAGVLRQLATLAATRDRRVETVALLFDDDPAGQARAASLRAAAATAGVKTADVPVPPGAALPPATTAAVLAAKPDAVLSLRQYPPDAALAAAAPLVLMYPGPDAAAIAGTFRSTGFTLDPLPARPGVTPVDAAFKARTGRSLDTTAAREITGLLLLADVFNRAGSTQPMDLRTALMATDTPGSETLMLWDGIRFDDSGQNVRATSALQQAADGAFRTVLPESIATATPTWPAPPAP